MRAAQKKVGTVFTRHKTAIRQGYAITHTISIRSHVSSRCFLVFVLFLFLGHPYENKLESEYVAHLSWIFCKEHFCPYVLTP